MLCLFTSFLSCFCPILLLLCSDSVFDQDSVDMHYIRLLNEDMYSSSITEPQSKLCTELFLIMEPKSFSIVSKQHRQILSFFSLQGKPWRNLFLFYDVSIKPILVSLEISISCYASYLFFHFFCMIAIHSSTIGINVRIDGI